MKQTFLWCALSLIVTCKAFDISEYDVAFIGHSETDRPVFETWNRRHRGRCIEKRGCIPINTHPYLYKYPGMHLRSPLIDYWQHIQVDKVLLELYCKGRRVAFALFDGSGSNSKNWFKPERLLASSFGDLFSDSCFDVFCIEGRDYARFFINQDHGECKNQRGWLAVLDRSNRKCKWNNHKKYPVFLYSKTHHKTFWDKNEYEKADCLVVYLKLNIPKEKLSKSTYG